MPPPSPDVSSHGARGFARALVGFGPLSVLSLLVIVLGQGLFPGLGGLLVLLWARASQTPLRVLGFVRPRSWAATLIGGIALGAAFKLVMKALVMPLLGTDPVNHAYHYLAGNRDAIPGFVFTLVIGAGFSEETTFRGYLFERLGRLLGTSIAAKVAIVILTSVLFGAAHYTSQGLAGAEQATFTGAVFGTIFATTRRLPLLMVMHAAFDLTAYGIIYWDVETRVAHWIFR